MSCARQPPSRALPQASEFISRFCFKRLAAIEPWRASHTTCGKRSRDLTTQGPEPSALPRTPTPNPPPLHPSPHLPFPGPGSLYKPQALSPLPPLPPSSLPRDAVQKSKFHALPQMTSPRRAQPPRTRSRGKGLTI